VTQTLVNLQTVPVNLQQINSNIKLFPDDAAPETLCENSLDITSAGITFTNSTEDEVDSKLTSKLTASSEHIAATLVIEPAPECITDTVNQNDILDTLSSGVSTIDLSVVPETVLLDITANRNKGQLSNLGSIASRRPPTKSTGFSMDDATGDGLFEEQGEWSTDEQSARLDR